MPHGPNNVQKRLAKKNLTRFWTSLRNHSPRACLFSCRATELQKKPVTSWKCLSQDNWAESDNFCSLVRQIAMGGNLAIKLGSDSQNLVTVDLDHDDHIEPFLQANPAFRNTLRTFGSKGAQFWFYATDDYPKEVRKLEINGTTVNAGEFRGGKCLSVIWGVHENGNVYTRVNDVPPIKFAFGDILWPTGWKCVEPKNNFKFGSNGSHNAGRPLAGKRGKGRRIGLGPIQ